MLGERQRKGSGVVIDLTQRPGVVKLAVGVDAGSTETRVALADYSDVSVFRSGTDMNRVLSILTQTYKVPSSYANVNDAKEIAPVSPNLEDNYDSTIVMLSNGAEKPLLSKHRVIRGRKINDAMGAVVRYLDSSTNKSDNIIFYTNIIDGIGYAILQKFNGNIPQKVEVHLSLSVRPKELNNLCRKKMTDNLVGSFMFIWGGINIEIKIKHIDFTTEPEAQIQGTTTVYDIRSAVGDNPEHYQKMADSLYDSNCYIHIEGGGSSIGVEVIKNGDIIDAASQTFPLGGNYLAQMFIDRYREHTGRAVTKEAANKAIVECVLRDGKNLQDVGELVAECKNQVGMDILERVRHEVIDLMSELILSDVEFITLGGRLFASDEVGTTIGEYFEQYLHQISPNTEVYNLSENFIAQGNLINCVNDESFDYFINKSDKQQAESFPTKQGTDSGSQVPDEKQDDVSVD